MLGFVQTLQTRAMEKVEDFQHILVERLRDGVLVAIPAVLGLLFVLILIFRLLADEARLGPSWAAAILALIMGLLTLAAAQISRSHARARQRERDLRAAQAASQPGLFPAAGLLGGGGGAAGLAGVMTPEVLRAAFRVGRRIPLWLILTTAGVGGVLAARSFLQQEPPPPPAKPESRRGRAGTRR